VLGRVSSQPHLTVIDLPGTRTSSPALPAASGSACPAGEQLPGELTADGVFPHQPADAGSGCYFDLRDFESPIFESGPELRPEEQRGHLRSAAPRGQRPRFCKSLHRGWRRRRLLRSQDRSGFLFVLLDSW
jgi:hypothetical protein